MSIASEEEKVGDEQLLCAYLADRDVACPRCGYNVRGLTGDTCPECGSQLMLTLNAAMPKQASMFAGLIGLAGALGYAAISLLNLGIQALLPGPPIIFSLVLSAGVSLVLAGVAIGLWFHAWWLIARQHAMLQWLSAIGCWMFALLMPMVVRTALLALL